MKGMRTAWMTGFALVLLVGSGAWGEEAAKPPFFPSLINTATGQAVKSTDFFPPSRCKGCHAQIYDQWKGSMHSNAVPDPVFQALWKLGSKETNGLTDKLCAGCHTAVGTVSEDVKLGADGEFQMSDIAKEGVQCDLCHSVVKSSMFDTPTGMPQNASIVVEPGLVKRGPYADAKPMWHQAAYSELHTRSEFCGNCHNVFHPVNNFHIENTYTEWKFSVYAQKGIQCQDCHMMPIEKAIETAKTLERPKNPGKASPAGPDRDNVFTHEFVGANFTITKLLGADKHSAIAVQRLQSAAELDVTLPAKAEAGALARVNVRVRNEGAGHNLPTSLTEVRQMWLEFVVTDAAGKEVYRSGGLDSKHDLLDGTVVFGTQAVDAAGHHTVKPWEIVRFDWNTTIPAKGFADREFAFLVPKDAAGALKIDVKLRYRSYPQAVANLLLGDKAPVLPIVDMTSAAGELKL